MEKINRNHDKSFEFNSLNKLFLLSYNFKEKKPQKDWFINKYKRYVSTINNDIENFIREERFRNLRKDLFVNSFYNKNHFSPNKKISHKINSKTKGNNFYLRKFDSNKKVNNLFNNNTKINSTFTNLYTDYKRNTQNIYNSIDRKLTKKNNNTNKIFLKLGFDDLPNIQGLENKNKYLTKHINNISEQTESLEKKLIKQEKMKYIGFKSKYNRLFNGYKKYQVDINQYLYPKRDKRFKFNLKNKNDGLNEGSRNMTYLMKQISRRIVNKNKNRLSVSEIKKEVELFKNKEKRLRERIKKSHEKFDYLVNDSNSIQKRIDDKCLKYNENNE